MKLIASVPVLFLLVLFTRSATASSQELIGAFTPSQAMKLLYGSYSRDKEASQWTPERKSSYPPGWPNEINVRVLLDAPYVEAGRSKHWIVTAGIPESSTNEYSCHGCGVLLGMAIFAENARGWAVEVSNLQYGEYGSWGYPPTIQLQPIGPDRFGLVIQTDVSGQGVDETFERIIVPIGGKFVEAFKKQISQSWDDDGCSGNVSPTRTSTCVAYDGGLDLKPVTGSEFYDLLLIRRVYRSLSKKTPEGVTVRQYSFDGSKYVIPPAAN